MDLIAETAGGMNATADHTAPMTGAAPGTCFVLKPPKGPGPFKTKSILSKLTAKRFASGWAWGGALGGLILVIITASHSGCQSWLPRKRGLQRAQQDDPRRRTGGTRRRVAAPDRGLDLQPRTIAYSCNLASMTSRSSAMR